MRFARSIIFLLGAALGLWTLPLRADGSSAEVAWNKLLRGELSLARTAACYFVFDLPQQTVGLKARGMMLREWKVRGIRTWGKPASLEVVTLVKKSSLFAPRRKKIKPGESQAGDTFELDVLELKDMPSAFVLTMSGGLSIYVRPGGGSFYAWLAGLGRWVKWHSWLPLKTIWFAVKKKPFSGLELELESPEEAKALYWAVGEGFKGLIFPLL